MRRLLAALAAVLLLAGCGVSSRAHLWVTPGHKLLTACVSSDCGSWSVTLNWQIPAVAGQTGYNLLSCQGASCTPSQYGTASASPFTFTGLDCSASYTLEVQAHNSGGTGIGTAWPTSYTSPACPTPPPGTGNFDDEFSGSSINTAPDGWVVFDNTFGNSPNAFQCDFATQATEGSGLLTETMATGSFSCTANGGGTSNSEGAEVQTRDFAFKYGTVVVRATNLTGGSAAWPAIWMIGDQCEWPTYLVANPCDWQSAGLGEEIDIDDQVQGSTVDGNYIHAACSYSNTPAISNTSSNAHTFELDWNSSSVVWKVDGTTVSTSSSCSPTSTMVLILTDQASTNTGPSYSPAASNFDYARVTPAGPITTINPSISGTAAHGNTLTANTGTWSPSSGVTFTYQWLRCNTSGLACNPVQSTNSCTTTVFNCSSTYTLGSSDIGDQMEVVVRGTDSSGATDYGSAVTATVS